jgi:hypothetical protein
MSKGPILYFHAPCFDGLVSGAMFWDFLETVAGWSRIRPRGVNYGIRPWWPKLRTTSDFAVVDFMFHPRAKYWIDHHATSFLEPSQKERYSRQASPKFVYDPEAPSCAALIWEHLEAAYGYRNARYAEMVEWATKIDAATYASVDEVFELAEPALAINAALSQFSDPRDCDEFVRLLRTVDLRTLADHPVIRRKAMRAGRLSAAGLLQFKRGARLEDGIVVFDVDARRSVINRYAPYRIYPGARYSAGIIRKSDGIRITAMRNPWKDFKSVPLGRIFEQVGGGGHTRVATVVLRADRAHAATDVLRYLVTSIRAHDRRMHRAS